MEFSKKWTNMLLFNKRSFLKTKTYYGDQNDYISRMRLNQVCFLFFLLIKAPLNKRLKVLHVFHLIHR